ncbi:hypothetical protein FOZ60_008939 [Perkinsus olseni]|uniref:Uncharacterized protein n=1 Tax=Perkinsus olseni TaxID=32597 RepID=A0A7J6PD79_PEROL|nr:hypothetical protein FOZ60_008939 [Perkinsus olseni]
MRAVSNPRCAQQDCSAETNSHHRQIQSLLDALVSEGLDAEKMSEIRDVLENREHSEIYALKERINRKFYAFGSSQVEIDVVNGKLLVRPEDELNNGKYGAVEKFFVHYEPIEREKAGLPPLAY